MDESDRDFTRQMRSTIKNPKFASKGGGSFNDRYTPQNGAAGKIIPIVFFKGEYSMPVTLEDGKGSRKLKRPYGIVLRHYHRSSNRYGRCSAGLADVRDRDGNVVLGAGKKPCLACHESSKGKDSGMQWANKLHVFNAVLLADFHMVASDRKNDKTGEFYKDPVQCEGRACKYCRDGVEKRFGRRVYWALGQSYSAQLMDFVDYTLALNCKCGGTITTPAYECPKCKACFHDLEANPLSEEDLEELRLDPHKCKACGYEGLMDAVYECDSCKTAKPLSLWDVALELYVSGEGKTTSIQVRRFKILQAEDWKKIEPVMTQVDLDRVFPNLSLTEQSKLYKLKIPSEMRDAAAGEAIPDDEKEVKRSAARSGSSAWSDDD